MITEFSLDKEFFGSPILHDVGMSAVHDFITESWIERGALVIPGTGHGDLLGLINKLPEKFKQRWLRAVEYGIKRDVDNEWWSFSDYGSFDEMCQLSTLFKTAFAEGTVAYVISENDEQKRRCINTGFELLGAGVCSESENLQRSSLLSRADIAPTDSAPNVWDQRLKPFAQYSKKILIVDRYLFTNVREAAARGQNEDSLRNFFSYLSQLNSRHNVKIISFGDQKDSELHAGVHDRINRTICRVPAMSRGLASLDLVSVADNFFRDEAHDRFIGFGKHICQIGLGMAVLGPLPKGRSTFTAKFDVDGELSARETASRQFRLWSESMI